MGFDLLIADSFNNKCEFRDHRETLQFLYRENKKCILRLGEERNYGRVKGEKPSVKDENHPLQSRPIFYCPATIEGQARQKISPISPFPCFFQYKTSSRDSQA